MPAERNDPDREERPLFAGLPAESVPAIAALFGATPREEPYAPSPAEPVYAIEHRGEPGNLQLVLWPSLGRVDVACGPHSWIGRDVVETEIIPDLEVIFRLRDRGLLAVAVSGQVLMVSGRDGEEREAPA